jgi:hypothetical protein
VFLAIGIVLLAIGLSIAVSVYVATSGQPDAPSGIILSGALFAGCGAITWALAQAPREAAAVSPPAPARSRLRSVQNAAMFISA